ncbi:Xin actin-binding repeat-containing protein 2 [Habropoda laboriosa]|uniref:Xin actin-binding repeat-containing protein 2 n=1 Tax=Habropoda laboriosa TaxID=597456 RepID=A0A0L7QYK3_9HYME|nr:Xin actin-binding repeat-containing protein 2 [Habropoda laboriosa]
MAEVATKKTINVVSSKKTEVCSVQSNNGLIELDNITASNKQLISLCDTNDDEDDLILTNNTRNELDTDDKSLQELIESELALRICSSTEEETGVEVEEQQETANEPETVKRIVLDRQPDTLDVNSEFIAAETKHSAIIEKPYSYQNGHMSPETKITESPCEENVVKPDPVAVGFREEEEEQVFDEQPEVGSTIVIEETTTNEIDQLTRDTSDDGKLFAENEENEEPCPSYPALRPAETTERLPDVTNVSQESFESPYEPKEEQVTTTPASYVDKYQEEKEVRDMVSETIETDVALLDSEQTDETNLRKKEVVDTWTDQSAFTEGQQTGQFSDNFDQTLCQEEVEEPITLEEFTKETSMENGKPDDVFVPLIEIENVILSQSESFTEAASTREFLDTERSVLSEDIAEHYPQEDSQVREIGGQTKKEEEDEEEGQMKVEEANDNIDEQNTITESSSELSVSEPTFIEKTEVVVSESSAKIMSETHCTEAGTDAEPVDEEHSNECESPARAPLATPDDETSDVSNACDSESREETIATSVESSPGTKGGTKTKKKKIEGVAGNDASANLTPRTKKTKKSKKSELEKENISVNCNSREPSMHPGPRQTQPETLDFSDEDDLSNVNVKSLTKNYVSEATRNEQDRCTKEKIATGVSIKQLCRSFGDISNMSDGDQTTYGKNNHTMDTEEKARSLGDLRVCEKGYSKFTKDALVFAGVSVKALRASYCSLANLTSEGKDTDRPSFNKFDALSKKTVLHVRSIDAGKVQQQLNAVGQNGDTNPNCRSCGKVVFQMEQTKAEGLVWHKNCFRCVQCSKQLNVDNYESHESTLYCKPHFKELFQPKPVEESDQPVRPRKPELIIRENEPKELPPDVVRASDKPDLGLAELSSLNVKSRFQVFEKAGTETNEIERSPSQIAVKRSPSILSKLAKFQAKGMDIGVADESLNGIPYEESSESEEEEEVEETEDVDPEIVKAKQAAREHPISFSKIVAVKRVHGSLHPPVERRSKEAGSSVLTEARFLLQGKQGMMKELYQQAVAGSERVTKINAAEEIQHSTHARSIKERFERGEPIAASDDETDSKPKPEKADEEVIAAGAFHRTEIYIFRSPLNVISPYNG